MNGRIKGGRDKRMEGWMGAQSKWMDGWMDLMGEWIVARGGVAVCIRERENGRMAGR